jgi:hypothetical protein
MVRGFSTYFVTFLLLLLSPNFGQAAERIPVATTTHFAFYSDFDTNLNDALIAAGLARKNGKPELFHSGAEAPCFEKLIPSERVAWDAAVDYYAKIISPAEWYARQQFLIRLQLVGFETDPKDPEDVQFLALARSFRDVAAPAYKACRWKEQDEKNRRWIAEQKPRLDSDEEKITSRLVQLYQKQWKTLPMLVDVVETVDWSGANTSWSDSGHGDILISSTTQGDAAFETIFHESSHVLMDRGDPVRESLEAAAKAADYKLPNDLWHVVLFYTTGEVVRTVLGENGSRDYKPMLYEIYERGGGWTQYREILELIWQPYVQGKQSLADAATSLVAELKKQPVQ